MQVSLQIIAFSLQTDGSGRPVLPLEKAELDKKDKRFPVVLRNLQIRTFLWFRL